ncbi:chromate transporter [Paenibacillus hexagrammi]|uniref:Chromate transporter n=1 Tax=Paenibacillus hexagrammi TaxID=2908839 RepID=A0ABY3SEW1_9BACL|nr:chromate transporter [Paenibacillus sp. YPD9-1]UJF32342.1 chromate transporter [Paenibacillus sp. YPD9-1]
MWQLFAIFFKIGCISFGGGYAVIPVIEHETLLHGWMDTARFQEVVSLAGMAPGPIATNTATLIGYETGGIGGAILSTFGMVLPSLLIIVLLAAFFQKVHEHRFVKNSFYGLKPVVTGFIAYAALHFGLGSGWADALSWTTIGTLLICGASVYGVLKHNLHPFAVIVASGLAGIILF